MQFQNTDAILDLSNVTTGGIKCSTTPSTLLLISTLSRNVQTQINTINTTITVLPTFTTMQSHANVWTSTNSFNISLPTSTLTPTTST